MRGERFRVRSARDRLQHGPLELHVALVVQDPADRAEDGGAGQEVTPRRFVRDWQSPRSDRSR